MVSTFDEASVLDARVTALDFEIKREVEILQFAVFPNNEGITPGWGLLGCLADDGPTLRSPKLGVTIPALESLTVEKAFSLLGEGAGDQYHGACEKQVKKA